MAKVGFFFWPYTPEYTVRMARLGEDLGFDLIGIADTPGNAMDPWVAMTLAAVGHLAYPAGHLCDQPGDPAPVHHRLGGGVGRSASPVDARSSGWARGTVGSPTSAPLHPA